MTPKSRPSRTRGLTRLRLPVSLPSGCVASFTDAWIETDVLALERIVRAGNVLRDLMVPHNLGCNVQSKFAQIQEWVVTDVTNDWTKIWQEQPAAP